MTLLYSGTSKVVCTTAAVCCSTYISVQNILLILADGVTLLYRLCMMTYVQLSKMVEESDSKKKTEFELQQLQATVGSLSNQVEDLQEGLAIAEASSSGFEQALEAARYRFAKLRL